MVRALRTTACRAPSARAPSRRRCLVTGDCSCSQHASNRKLVPATPLRVLRSPWAVFDGMFGGAIARSSLRHGSDVVKGMPALQRAALLFHHPDQLRTVRMLFHHPAICLVSLAPCFIEFLAYASLVALRLSCPPARGPVSALCVRQTRL